MPAAAFQAARGPRDEPRKWWGGTRFSPTNQTAHLPPPRQRRRSSRRHLLQRRARPLPPHGGRSARARSRPPPLRRHRGELALTPARTEAVPHRPGAGDADPRGQRPAARGLPAGPAQNPGLQLAPGAPSPTLRSALAAVLARRIPGPHLPAPVVVALEEARAFRSPTGLSRGGWPRVHRRPPPRRRPLAVFPLSTGPRRRRAHLQSPARDVDTV